MLLRYLFNRAWNSIKIKYENSKLYIYFDFKYIVNIKFIEHIHTSDVADVYFEFLKYNDVKLERKVKNDVASSDLIKREFNGVKS